MNIVVYDALLLGNLHGMITSTTTIVSNNSCITSTTTGYDPYDNLVTICNCYPDKDTYDIDLPVKKRNYPVKVTPKIGKPSRNSHISKKEFTRLVLRRS
jgi:hypothetical protein